MDAWMRLRRALIALSAASLLWAAAVALTGGIVFELAGVAVTSRNPRNPALLALASAIGAWLVPIPDRRGSMFAWWFRWIGRWSRLRARWPAWADAAGAVAVFGILIQISALTGARPLWADEEMIALNVRDRSVTTLAGPLWMGQSAPLGWLVLERTALVTFGTGEIALRLVPMLFGGATLLLAVWVGRRWLHPIAAALFVLLCAISPWLAHYALELKHYSADAFWALLLPAVAVSAAEAQDSAVRARRTRWFWACTALAHWFSNGGLLATPACVILLLVISWRRHGARATIVEHARGAALATVSFAAHFALSIQHTLGSEYLRSYWAGGLPPGQGFAQTMAWLGGRFQPLAETPVGTDRWMAFWIVALGGSAMAARHLRVVLLALPVTAFALGGLAIVPLLDRLALWMVPALYLGVASFADAALRLAATAYRRKQITAVMVSLAMAVVVFDLSSDILRRGWGGVEFRRIRDRSHGLDDRSAVAWLMALRQPGDAIVTTHLSLPAIWWYGGVDLSLGGAPGRRLPDATPVFEASFGSPSDCASAAARLAGDDSRRRVLTYVGFDKPTPDFADLLANALGGALAVRAERTFADASRVAVIELTRAPAQRGERPGDGPPAARSDRCIAFQPATRW